MVVAKTEEVEVSAVDRKEHQEENVAKEMTAEGEVVVVWEVEHLEMEAATVAEMVFPSTP